MSQENSLAERSLTAVRKPVQASLRRRLKLQAIVPHKVEELLDSLWERQDEFDAVIQCPECEAPLHLEELAFGWPYGPYEVYFPGVPAYRCTQCNKTFFPEAVRAELAACVEKTVRAQEPATVQRNPRALAFARRFAD